MADTQTLLTARPSRLGRLLLARYFRRRARKAFAAVLIRGLERLEPWDEEGNAAVPLLLAANHSSWWDAVLPIVISCGTLHQDAYGIMETEQLRRYSFFRRAGIFSVDRSNARSASRSIQYASDLLRNTPRVLWIFPQGSIAPNDLRPIRAEAGTAHIARNLERLALAPVALRYEVGRDEHPRAYVSIGEIVTLTREQTRDPKRLTVEIARMMEAELDALRDAMLAESHTDFTLLVEGRRSISTAWDRMRGR